MCFCGFDLCASFVFLVLCCMVGCFCWCVLHATHVFVCSVCELLCDGVCFVFASCSRWWWRCVLLFVLFVVRFVCAFCFCELLCVCVSLSVLIRTVVFAWFDCD